MDAIELLNPATLGAISDSAILVNPLKILAVILLTFGWAAVAQWIDKDTDAVKTKREQWNFIAMAGALVGFFALLFVPLWQGPLFFAGVAVWLAIAGGAVFLYIMHRNGRVTPNARVLTPAHFKRLLAGGPKKARKGKSKGHRVRVENHEGKFVEPPDDLAEFEEYEAAQDFLYDVLWRRASDVDVLAGKEKYRVVYRVDGVATENKEGLTPEVGERVFRFLKRVGGLNVEEIRRPQRGRVEIHLLAETDKSGKTEVITSGTTAGERLQLHVQGQSRLLRTHELGMAEARHEALKQMMAKPTGLVLFSAPPGHGLTTTQYAVARGHDAYMQNIHTLEKKPLLEVDNVTQQVYDLNAGVPYARMLQTVLRREPDIVIVSDCEERQTSQIATRAALEDRKIYLGIQAADCFDALDKYLGLVEDYGAAANALLGVINQRLVRILCTECRQAFKPDEATLKKLNLPAGKIDRFYRPPPEPVLDKKGNEIICPNCRGTGYVGRTGVFEVLVADSAIAKLLSQGASVNRIKSQCRKNKMYYLQEEALLKVIDGTTSMNEVLRVMRETDKR
jgi:type II secretory ATPase GspE/PulE/Tfp pilus assembly ATPase PilB-like protein